MTSTNKLFSSYKIGSLQLKNRIVMAPMTRAFSTNNTPNTLNIEYYRKRAAGGVGLIITEGTIVNHIAASGYDNVLKNRIRWMIYKLKIKKKFKKIPRKKGLYKVL